MGPAHLDAEQTPLREKTQQLLEKAGFQVVYPEGMDRPAAGNLLLQKAILSKPTTNSTNWP